MSFYKTFLRTLIASLVLASCSSKNFDSEAALWEYLKEPSHGYVQKKHVQGIDYSLVYRPTDLLVKQSLVKVNNKAIDSLRKHYGKYLYFNLSMGKHQKELLSTIPKDRQAFGAMVNQLAFGMGNYIHCYTAQKDTLSLVDYIYPRMYGVSNATKMMFVYEPTAKELEEKYLFFEIKDLGMQTGDIKFKIPTKVIKNQPRLNFVRIK